MRIYFAGQWHDRDQKIEVRDAYDQSLVDTVPQASAAGPHDNRSSVATALRRRSADRRQ